MDQFEKGLHGLTKTAAVAFAAVGTAAVAGLGAAVKKAGDLEQAVTNIATIKPTVNISGAMESLAEMSTRVPQSASALADSLYNIFSSIDVGADEGIELLETFAQGATGAGTSAEVFGTSILGVMNAYGLAVKDADHISDVFFNTVNAGVVSGEELAGSLGPVTQSAKNAGVSLDELGALIAGVTKEGGPAAQNINNLNNLFMKFTTKDAVASMKGMGVSVQDAAGNFRPILDVMGDLKARLGPMTEAQRANALQAIFPDAQARTGASVILSQLDFVNGALKTNQEQVGSASKAYELMSGTFNSQSKILGNTFDSLLIQIGSKVLPAITPIVTAFAEWLPAAFAAVEQAVKDLQPTFDVMGQVLRVVADVIGEIAKVVLPPLMVAFGFLRDNWDSVAFAMSAVALKVLIPAFVAWASAAIAATAATIAALLPVLLPLAAVGAAAFVLHKVWSENLGGVQEKTQAVVGFLSGAFQTIVGALESLWKNAQAVWVQFTENPPRMIGLMIGSIVGFFLTLPTRIAETLGDALGAVGRFVEDAGAAFDRFIRDNSGAIGDFLSGLPGKFKDGAISAVQGLINGLGSMAGAAFNAVKNLFGGIIDAVKDAIRPGSASKVFTAFGVSMGEGLAKGIDDSAPLVAMTMARALDGITAVATKGRDNVSAIWAQMQQMTGAITPDLIPQEVGRDLEQVGSVLTSLSDWAVKNLTAGISGALAPDIGFTARTGMVSPYGAGPPPQVAAVPPIILQLDGRVIAEVVGDRIQQRSFLTGGALG